MKIFHLIIILMVAGCSHTPEPFETGEKTTAPYGYTEMIERESR